MFLSGYGLASSFTSMENRKGVVNPPPGRASAEPRNPLHITTQQATLSCLLEFVFVDF